MLAARGWREALVLEPVGVGDEEPEARLAVAAGDQVGAALAAAGTRAAAPRPTNALRRLRKRVLKPSSDTPTRAKQRTCSTAERWKGLASGPRSMTSSTKAACRACSLAAGARACACVHAAAALRRAPGLHGGGSSDTIRTGSPLAGGARLRAWQTPVAPPPVRYVFALTRRDGGLRCASPRRAAR